MRKKTRRIKRHCKTNVLKWTNTKLKFHTILCLILLRVFYLPLQHDCLVMYRMKTHRVFPVDRRKVSSACSVRKRRSRQWDSSQRRVVQEAIIYVWRFRWGCLLCLYFSEILSTETRERFLKMTVKRSTFYHNSHHLLWSFCSSQ